MKTLCMTAVLLIGTTLWSAAQSCPDLTQYPQGDICSAPGNLMFTYYYLGDETDTYLWYVTGGTIIGGGGHGDWFINIRWTPGATFKLVAIEKIGQWGAYCTDEISTNCP